MLTIRKWSGQITIHVAEGTTPVSETFQLSGNGCDRDELPSAVAESIEKTMAILGNRAGDSAKIDNLTKALEAAEQKVALMQEAMSAPVKPPIADAGDLPPPAKAKPKTPKRSK